MWPLALHALPMKVRAETCAHAPTASCVFMCLLASSLSTRMYQYWQFVSNGASSETSKRGGCAYPYKSKARLTTLMAWSYLAAACSSVIFDPLVLAILSSWPRLLRLCHAAKDRYDWTTNGRCSEMVLAPKRLKGPAGRQAANRGAMPERSTGVVATRS